MSASTFANGQVRVEFAPTLVVRERDARTRSIDPTSVARADLTEQLARNGFEVVADLDVLPTRALADDPTADAVPIPITLDVAVSPEQASVVLAERDGLWSWHLPNAEQSGRRSLAVFELPAGSGPPGVRGLAGVGALVLRFAAPLIDGLAIKFLERDVSQGLVHLRSADPDSWSPIDTLAELGLPATPRILLFVHGTFSSTKGAFAQLGEAGTPGRTFLDDAIQTYDAVIGFDHPTLSVGPLANAEDLYRRLSTHFPAGASVDVICHSRGGLVVRSLVERILPTAQWTGTVDRIAFVGVPNAGTHFADPDRWSAFVDLYTNILIASASQVVGGQGTVGDAILSAGIKGVGALVKYLTAYSVDGGGIPGLAAMEPGGTFLAELNEHQVSQPGPVPPWFAVTSNFHVAADAGSGSRLPLALKLWLAEGFVDELLDGGNDLVVDTDSMSAIDEPPGAFLRDVMDFGVNDTVHHLNYFAQYEVGAAFEAWLIHRQDHRFMERALPSMEGDEAMPELDGHDEAIVVDRPRTRGIPRFDRPRNREVYIDTPLDRGIVLDRNYGAPAAAPEIGGGGGDGMALEPPPKEPVAAHVRAEMPSKITVAVPLKVRVLLSRNEIPASPDTNTEDMGVVVGEDEELTVQIIPKRNVTITGSDVDKIELPPGSGTSEVAFSLLPSAAGPVQVTVLLRRHSAEIAASLTLRGEARQPNDPDRRRAVLRAEVVAAATTSVVLDDAVWLEISQLDGPGYVQFQYDLRLPGGAPSLRYQSGRLRNHERFVADLFADINRAWAQFSGAPKNFRNFLQNRGSDLFERLFPDDMQAKLWELRNQLTTVLLLADEPYFPWELVHLKPPTGPREQQPRFLAQYGLLRWQFVPFPKEPELRARPGKVYSLCARKVDPRFLLVESLAEAEWLANNLGAADARASYTAVRKLLKRGGFDVLHFSGHGVAETTNVAGAKIMLDDRVLGGNFTRQFLSATDVFETARLAGTDGTGPLVVLNACQAGLGGEQLSSLGGFARAFLEAGAQAFVACLWSVKQQPSRVFVEALYKQLIAGATLAQAVSSARDETHTPEDPATWLAYAVYGRPDATLVLQ